MTRMDPARRHALMQLIQWLCFGILAISCYFIMTSGSSVKPLLLIPLAICISAHCGEIEAMGTGVVGGLLTDIACGKLLGYNAVWLVTCCVLTSLLHSYYLRDKLLNILLLTAACTAVQGYLDFMFYYAIWGHEDVELIYTRIMLPSGIMTMVSTIPIWLIVRWLCRKCGSRRTLELEKTIISGQ